MPIHRHLKVIRVIHAGWKAKLNESNEILITIECLKKTNNNIKDAIIRTPK